MKFVWIILLAVLLVAAIGIPVVYEGYVKNETRDEFFFGVSFGGDTTEEAKLLIDRVKDYTNLFIINSYDISIDEGSLDEICQYLVDSDMCFMVFFDWISREVYPWQQIWLDTAEERFGDKFLGVYLYDEPGGRQIDTGFWKGADNPGYNETILDYSEAAEAFVTSIGSYNSTEDVKSRNMQMFTSDYALYWFDYKAGYDAVFVEFGWNYSRQLHVALGRGAAEVQNKEWGVIITWTFQNPPYMESAEELYNDLVLAYNNGAKYIVVFNYPTNLTDYGILSEEHLNSLKKFWTYTNVFPQKMKTSSVAFVLPENYGYGFRGPQDKIWGIWGPDELSEKLWNDTNYLLVTFDKQLDLVYDEREFNLEQRYKKLLYWTETY
jgi:hypothetical protein